MQFSRHAIGVIALLTATLDARAQQSLPLIDIRKVDPTIVVSLRYASAKNITGHALYAPNMPALVQPEVAERLSLAQRMLARCGYRLQIWDAYRPPGAQLELWRAVRNDDYVADPNAGAGSLHSWGVAVDATLIDTWNNPVKMPSDFDDLTPAAMWRYTGNDPIVRSHLHLLQFTMAQAGFYGLRTEWWHFTIEDWQKFLPPEMAKRASQVLGTSWQGKL
jgi:D-alanyl-D-alanine dipeptidase